jgi:hypothetical protein
MNRHDRRISEILWRLRKAYRRRTQALQEMRYLDYRGGVAGL